jgi:hypothetical protein
MRKVESKQRSVLFVWCPSPVTIDKRAEWGKENADNLQRAPNGAFLKMSSPTEVSHLVQPNADKTAPVGWVPSDGPGLFNKAPIWVDQILRPGDFKHLRTLDGDIEYEIKEPSMVTYNDRDGKANLEDGWVQTVANLQKNYFI